VVTTGAFIEAGSPVEVIDASGNRVVVETAETPATPEGDPQTQA